MNSIKQKGYTLIEVLITLALCLVGPVGWVWNIVHMLNTTIVLGQEYSVEDIDENAELVDEKDIEGDYLFTLTKWRA